jgi:hypothetical protein
MGIFKDNPNTGMLFGPKVGESKIVTIVGQMERVQDAGSDNNYKMKGNVNAGYFDTLPVMNEETGEETKLKINTWKLYFAFKNAEGIDVGDTIEISHPSNGEYIIKKV